MTEEGFKKAEELNIYIQFMKERGMESWLSNNTYNIRNEFIGEMCKKLAQIPEFKYEIINLLKAYYNKFKKDFEKL